MSLIHKIKFNLSKYLKISSSIRLLKSSIFFDKEYYLHTNPDIKVSGINPLDHFHEFGWKEGRNPSKLFDTNKYLSTYKDVKLSGLNPLIHFLQFGIHEGRINFPVSHEESIVESDTYVEAESIFSTNTIYSFVKDILLDPRVFNWEYYQNYYKDVQQFSQKKKHLVEEHWIKQGINESRLGSPKFSLKYYKINNPDVLNFGAKDNISVIFHYIFFGVKENRIPIPSGNNEENQIYTYIDGSLEYNYNKSNLVLIAHHVSDNIYGGERSFLDIIEAIDEINFNIYVILPVYNSKYITEIQEFSTRIIVFNYVWWNKNLNESQDQISKFRTILRQLRADIVHINTVMCIDALVAAHKEKITSIIHVREILSKDDELIKIIDVNPEEIIHKISHLSDYIICNSKSTLQEFGEKTNSYILYNTIPNNLFNVKPNFSETNFKVGIISSNLAKKGIIDFVKLADRMNEIDQKISFYIIGEKTDLIKKIKQDRDHGLHTANLFIIDYLDSQVEAIQLVDIVVNFSHFAESFGRTVAEAMAASKVVIAYDHGALPELIEHEINGYLIPFKKPLCAIPHIIGLKTNQSQYLQLAKNGKLKAELLFQKDKFSYQLNNIYNDILKYQLDLDSTEYFWQKNYIKIGDSLKNYKYHEIDKRDLRVAYFLWHFPVPSETFVISELKYFFDLGMEIKVFCKASPFTDFKLDFNCDITLVNSIDEFVAKLEESNINHIHSHFTYPTVTNFVWPACKTLNITFSFIAHAQDIFKYENIELNRISEIVNDKLCLKLFLPGRFHRTFLNKLSIPVNKVSINPQVPYLNDFDFRNRNNFTYKICAIGRFVEKKGFENLIRAGNLLEHTNITIDIYGYGELKEHFEKIINSENIKNVSIKSKLKNSREVSNILKDYDILIQPSIVAQNGDMDGIPTVLMEAMSVGTIVLSSNIASISDLIKDGQNGFLCEIASPFDIAEKIIKIYAFTTNYLENLRHNAFKKIIDHFNIKYITSHLLDIWSMYSIDIILVTYVNDSCPYFDELKEIISRIYQFTTLKFEIYVIDNGSDTNTLEYLNELKYILPNFNVFLQEENMYVGGGINIALENSKNEFAFYICSVEGFIVESGWEVEAIKYFRENPKVGLAGSLAYSPFYFFGKDFPNGNPKFSEFRNQSFASENPKKEFKHVQGGVFGIRRKMYEKIGGFNNLIPQQYTDVEYSFYAESNGWFLGEIPTFLSVYKHAKPNMYSKLDESKKILHPGKLSELAMYQTIINEKINYCNICYWFGKSFVELNKCKKCNSLPKDRALFKYLVESSLTYRGLEAVFIDPSDSILQFLKESFSPYFLHIGEDQISFDNQSVQRSKSTYSLTVFCKNWHSITNDTIRKLDEFELLSDKIIIVSNSNVITFNNINAMLYQFLHLGYKIENTFSYSSVVQAINNQIIIPLSKKFEHQNK